MFCGKTDGRAVPRVAFGRGDGIGGWVGEREKNREVFGSGRLPGE